jgi:hypothetical protein
MYAADIVAAAMFYGDQWLLYNSGRNKAPRGNYIIYYNMVISDY